MSDYHCIDSSYSVFDYCACPGFRLPTLCRLVSILTMQADRCKLIVTLGYKCIDIYETRRVLLAPVGCSHKEPLRLKVKLFHFGGISEKIQSETVARART